jgi:hypothetical protein
LRRRTNVLDTRLELLLLSRHTISTNSLDTLVVKDRFDIVRILILEANVALLGLKDAREVDLITSESDRL